MKTVLEDSPREAKAAARLLSRRQVGVMCGVHEGTVKRWEFTGKLKAVKLNSRVTRYELEEVNRLIEEARVA